MRKVISLALFRAAEGEHRHEDSHQYFPRFLPGLLRAARAVFPEWTVTIHHDGTIDHAYYGSTLKELEKRGILHLVYCGPVAALCHAMLWRLYPVFDADVSHVLCRDLDSLPMPREKAAIDQWLASGKAMHILHDHEHHGPGAFIPGGLCGFDTSRFRSLTGLHDLRELLEYGYRMGLGFHAKGDDQVLLNEWFPPRIGTDFLLHHYNRETGHTQVDGYTASHADTLAPYTGGVFNPQAAISWYNDDNFPSSIPISEAEQAMGESWP